MQLPLDAQEPGTFHVLGCWVLHLIPAIQLSPICLPAHSAAAAAPACTHLQEQRSGCPFQQRGLRNWDDPVTWGGRLPSVGPSHRDAAGHATPTACCSGSSQPGARSTHLPPALPVQPQPAFSPPFHPAVAFWPLLPCPFPSMPPAALERHHAARWRQGAPVGMHASGGADLPPDRHPRWRRGGCCGCLGAEVA